MPCWRSSENFTTMPARDKQVFIAMDAVSFHADPTERGIRSLGHIPDFQAPQGNPYSNLSWVIRWMATRHITNEGSARLFQVAVHTDMDIISSGLLRAGLQGSSRAPQVCLGAQGALKVAFQVTIPAGQDWSFKRSSIDSSSGAISVCQNFQCLPLYGDRHQKSW